MPAKRRETVLVSREQNVAILTLNRPKVQNALSRELMDDLRGALDEIAGEESVRAVVITGAGQAFSVGGDVQTVVSRVSAMTPWEYREYMEGFYQVIFRITELEKPVIAAVNGITAGGACELALACDIRIASEEARFASAFVRMGIIPDLGGTFWLPRLVGVGMAKFFTFTGEIIDAKEAERIGLVEKVVPAGQLQAVVGELARRLAQAPTKAIAFSKLAINRSLNLDLRASLDYVKSLTPILLQTNDHKEAVNAFLEKRKPVFQGK